VLERIHAERDTIHGIEKALHGQALVSDLRHVPEIRGEALLGVNVAADKITRALAWSPVAEEGKCFLISRNADAIVRNDSRNADALVRNEGRLDPNNHQPQGDSEADEGVRFTSGWIREFLEEVAAFPVGTNDDQIDAVSIAVQLLKVPRYKAGGF
jgi:phage terminase large subunit-like protein